MCKFLSKLGKCNIGCCFLTFSSCFLVGKTPHPQWLHDRGLLHWHNGGLWHRNRHAVTDRGVITLTVGCIAAVKSMLYLMRGYCTERMNTLVVVLTMHLTGLAGLLHWNVLTQIISLIIFIKKIIIICWIQLWHNRLNDLAKVIGLMLKTMLSHLTEQH